MRLKVQLRDEGDDAILFEDLHGSFELRE